MEKAQTSMQIMQYIMFTAALVKRMNGQDTEEDDKEFSCLWKDDTETFKTSEALANSNFPAVQYATYQLYNAEYSKDCGPDPLIMITYAASFFFYTRKDKNEKRPFQPFNLEDSDVRTITQLFVDILEKYKALSDAKEDGKEDEGRVLAAVSMIVYDRLQRLQGEKTPNKKKIKRAAAIPALEHFNSRSIVPTNYTYANTKTANLLTTVTREGIENIVRFSAIVSGTRAKKKAVTKCVITFTDENTKIKGGKSFTEYDRTVYNAISSIYDAGNQTFTAATVWRAMTGRTGNEKPTDGQERAVTRSINKMRGMFAEIDYSQEIRMQGITIDGDNVNGYGLNDPLLLLREEWMLAGKDNHKIRVYKFASMPILFEHAKRVNRVCSLPAELMNVKRVDKNGKATTRSLPYTERRSILTFRIYSRINGMKGRNNLNSRHISLLSYTKGDEPHPGIYEIVGFKDPTKKQASDIRKDVELILSYAKATGFISGYSPYTKGKSIAGYEISL